MVISNVQASHVSFAVQNFPRRAIGIGRVCKGTEINLITILHMSCLSAKLTVYTRNLRVDHPRFVGRFRQEYR